MKKAHSGTKKKTNNQKKIKIKHWTSEDFRMNGTDLWKHSETTETVLEHSGNSTIEFFSKKGKNNLGVKWCGDFKLKCSLGLKLGSEKDL